MVLQLGGQILNLRVHLLDAVVLFVADCQVAAEAAFIRGEFALADMLHHLFKAVRHELGTSEWADCKLSAVPQMFALLSVSHTFLTAHTTERERVQLI